MGRALSVEVGWALMVAYWHQLKGGERERERLDLT